MAWIESHQTLKDHPKLKKAARLAGINKVQMIGHLHLLWWWMMDYAPTGELTGYDAMDIADAVSWDGEPETFTQALLDCGRGDGPGFLEKTNGILCVHDWGDYAGKLVEKRKRDAERKRRGRLMDIPSPSMNSDQVDMMTSDGHPMDVHRMSAGHPSPGAGTEPNRTEPNHVGSNLEPENKDHVDKKGPAVKKGKGKSTPSKSSKPLSLQQAMFGAVEEVCKMDGKLKRGQIAQTASKLLKAGYTPEKVLAFQAWWYEHDWRGEKGQPPNTGQLLNSIKRSLEQAKAGKIIGTKKIEVIFPDGEVVEQEVTVRG